MSNPVKRGPSPVAFAAAFAVIYLVWGSTFLGIRIAVETLPPLTMAAVRFLVSGAVMMFASAGARPRPSPRQWGNALIVGGLFFLGNHGLVSLSARFLPSSLICLIVATEVPVIALLSSQLLPNHPLTLRTGLGAALGILGVMCLFVGQGNGTTAPLLLPSLGVLGASLSWATGVVYSQKLDFPPDPFLRAAMQMTCGGALLSLASVAHGEPAMLQLDAFSVRSVAALAYLIVFGSVIAFGCYTWLLKHVRIEAVATHAFVNPLVAVLVGIWLGGEKLQVAHAVAGAFILGSVWVIVVGGKKKPSAATLQASAL